MKGSLSNQLKGVSLLLIVGVVGFPAGALASLATLAPNTWEQQAKESAVPSGRGWIRTTYDQASGEVLLFGGSAGTYLNDMWAYDASSNQWTKLRDVDYEVTDSPERRESPTLTYDPYNDVSWVYGGPSSAWDQRQRASDLWQYDRSTNNWTEIIPPSVPAHRFYPGIAFDSVRNRLLFYGGEVYNPVDETWSFDVVNNVWTQLFPSVKPPPLNGIQNAMVYDERNDVFILFGGDNTNGIYGKTWVFDPQQQEWRDMQPATSPPARTDHAMVYDSSNGVVILYGGTGVSGTLSDTWVYDYTQNQWFEVSASSPAVGPRTIHSLAYDEANDVVVLFGGASSPSITADNYTYLFRYQPQDDGTPIGAPVNLQLDDSGESHISMSWDAPTPGADGTYPVRYIIYRDGSEVAQVPDEQFTDSALPAGQSYSYEIYSEDTFGVRSTQPATAIFSTLADSGGAAISAVGATNLTTNSADIRWQTSEDAQCDVTYQPASGGAPQVVSSPVSTAHSVTLQNLTESTQYDYSIECTDLSGNITSTVANSFTTLASTLFTLQEGMDGLSGIADTMIYSYHDWLNYGDRTSLSLADNHRTMIRFPIFVDEGGVLQRSTPIDSAKLEFYVNRSAYNAYFNVHELLKPWEENAATWNQASTSVPWDMPGASSEGTDYMSNAIDTFNTNATGWVSVDVTASVEAFRIGSRDNNGWIFLLSNTTWNNPRIYSSEYGTDPSLRPRLVVKLSAGSSDSPPTASFTVTPSSGDTDTVFTFDAGGSSDDNGISSYDWDFGDGNVASGQTVQHQYAASGDYMVQLTVCDELNQIDTASMQVAVASIVSVPQVEVTDIVLMGTVSDPDITEITVGGMTFPVNSGSYSAELPLVSDNLSVEVTATNAAGSDTRQVDINVQ